MKFSPSSNVGTTCITVSFHYEGTFCVPKTILIPSFFYWSVYTKPGEWGVKYMCVRSIVFSSDSATFLISFWNCSDSMVFFAVQIFLWVYHFLQLCLTALFIVQKSEVQIINFYIAIQWNLSNPTHQGTREMCRIVQDVGILGFHFS